jgi:hypothetical protein
VIEYAIRCIDMRRKKMLIWAWAGWSAGNVSRVLLGWAGKGARACAGQTVTRFQLVPPLRVIHR